LLTLSVYFSQGAARGVGWQKVCSFINLCAYYAVGIPSAAIFAFVLKIGGKVSSTIFCAVLVGYIVPGF
jgi:MATE family multidrug resistance protein